ncbi:hypothetical protein BGZ95_011408 [Linnemannia exigua]|uniref:Zinc finger PHD-type domain-containing protein n=1 Tax=Linnemannia exigua TaxID=604196 RepID=A0AAD4DA43_9FUNG|nr:hypothetical protein BGZ95_011408 [Linnemannia exigua]
MVAPPRRSNRYGLPKGSKKKEEEDDGGQTRCVCNQQHHEGVMIQCETCKVWQHCPCVGLGDGEVTPDKYYCDSCRPENHPYRVQNGQLVSNAKPMTKPTKKRSTMNSKEASIPMDLMLAQQKWNEEHQDEIEDDLPPRATFKRRRKTESSTTDIDDEHHINHQDTIDTANAASSTSINRSKKKDSADDRDSASPPSSSPKSLSSNGRNTTKKVSAKSTSKACSRSNSPNSQGSDPQNGSHPSNNKESSSAAATSTTSSSSPKTGRSHDDTAADAKTSGSSESSAPSTKRRKTASKSDMPSRSNSAAIEEDDDSGTKNESDGEHTETLTRSRKGGAGSRTNSKRSSGHQDDTESREDSVAPVSIGSTSSSSSNSGHQQVPSVSSPAPSTKKGYSKRTADRGQSARIGSRNSTPVPGQNESTPQSMTPAAPAAVRYPSPKMTLQEMAKRAKQMLDYISRVQIELADHKSKSASVASPEGDSSMVAPTRRPSASPSTLHRPIHHGMDVDEKKLNDVSSLGFRLPMPAASASSGSGIHGDSQVCPDLSRSSMDSTSSTVDGMQEPSSPVDMKVPTSLNAKDLNMTIKVIPMHSQDPALLLSTPPLSVHDHQHHHTPHQPSGSPESDTNHEPLTPPHQPLEGGGSHGEQHQQDQGLSEEVRPDTLTSMDLMDKLTGDLIRFQEKFGAFA